MSRRIPIVDRLMARVEVEAGGCWIWTGAVAGGGYGIIGTNDVTPRGNPRPAYVHRVAYEHFVGPIKEGLEIDHLCRTRRCVNPEHLEAVTHSENQRRGQSPCGENARAEKCKHGHAFDTKNTRVRDGKRSCRRCDADRAAARRARIAA